MKLATFVLALAAAFLIAGTANAWRVTGHVLCDSNQNGEIDGLDQGLDNVRVVIESSTFFDTRRTDESGYFKKTLPDSEDTYTLSLDASTLPPDATILIPGAGQYVFTLTDEDSSAERTFLIDSEICAPIGCWMTAGGVKFEQVVGGQLATRGPKDSFGGNVFPGCSPDAGEGGQWNHVAHSLKLHFLGTSIHTVRCGNVPGIDTGSESPVTPFNFIEFEGIGWIQGIHGNKVPKTDVFFTARVEDRNEPGSGGQNDGDEVDRYQIHVFESLGDPIGTTHILVDENGDASDIDPVVITGGNLQLHISGCDEPAPF